MKTVPSVNNNEQYLSILEYTGTMWATKKGSEYFKSAVCKTKDYLSIPQHTNSWSEVFRTLFEANIVGEGTFFLYFVSRILFGSVGERNEFPFLGSLQLVGRFICPGQRKLQKKSFFIILSTEKGRGMELYLVTNTIYICKMQPVS